MGQFGRILTASLAALGTAAASAVIDLVPSNFDGMNAQVKAGVHSID